MDNSTLHKPLQFLKMHGLGNDFVVLDSRGQSPVTTPHLARALGDRHRGVGFDQLAEIRTADNGIALDFWNSDGSRAGACGNATRCVAELVLGQSGASQLEIQTARGTLRAVREADGEIAVNMGQPQFDWRDIPLSADQGGNVLPIEGRPFAVGMGNPHCVFFVDDAGATDPAKTGPEIEHHPLFPQATNVEFATVRADGTIRMRVWERGTGITLACGSGACATAVAAASMGLAGRRVEMELDGGWLSIDWRDDGVWMKGPTTHVYSGVLGPDFPASA